MGEPSTIFRGNQRLRKNRFSISGHYYFVTTCCFDRKSLLDSPPVFDIISDSVDWMEENNRWEWFCFTCMPDHFHLVFKLREGSLSSVMTQFKSFTGKRIKSMLMLDHPVWQRQYWDRNIRDNDEFRKIVDYCYWNSFHKKLVSTPADYPFWKTKITMGP